MKQHRDRRRPKSRNGPTFQLVEDPFGNLGIDERTELMVETGQAAAEEFVDSLDKLQNRLASLNPLHLLTTLSSHFLTAGVTSSGKTKQFASVPLNQSHVELTQALALRSITGKSTLQPVIPEAVEEICDLLLAVGNAFNAKRFVQILDSHSETERAVLRLQERVRTHTQFVRNWGYYKQVVSIIRELYGELDDACRERHGVTTTSVIALFELHAQNIEQALNLRLQRMARVAQAETIADMVSSYYEQLEDLEDNADEMIEFFHLKEVSRELVWAMLIGHSDLRLTEDYSIHVPEIAASLGVEEDALHQFLPQLSLRFGDLADRDPEHFFLDNPIWAKPLIGLSSAKYFCPLPQVFFGFCLKILDALFDDEENGGAIVTKRRADFLEHQTQAVFREAFPDATVIPNVRWSLQGEQFENDVCVKLDSYLLIVEAKSAAISQPALRGAPKRARRHIADLFEAPARQSARLKTELEQSLVYPSAANATLDRRLVDALSGVRQISRLAVTLDDFATIQSHMGHIAETGWFSDDIDLAPVMTLADLRVAFGVLPSAVDKFHYLVSRAKLQRQVAYVGDELDLIGLYLDTAFDLSEEFHGGRPVFIVGHSAGVDEYFIAEDQGISRRPPTLLRTKWWSDMLAEVQRRFLPGWLETSLMLADIGHPSQRRAERLFKTVKKRVKRDWRRPQCRNSVTLEPKEWRNDAVALMAYRKRQRPERNELMAGVANTVFGRSHAKRCLVVAIDIDDIRYPYNAIAVIARPHGT